MRLMLKKIGKGAIRELLVAQRRVEKLVKNQIYIGKQLLMKVTYREWDVSK